MASFFGNKGIISIPGVEADFPSSGDLSSNQYYPVTLAADEQVALQTTKGGKVIGVLQNKPDAENKAAKVMLTGVTMVKLGGTISTGNYLVAEATNGRAIQADAAGQHVFGIALADGSANDLIPCKLVDLETNAADA